MVNEPGVISPADLEKIARTELNEDPSRRDADIKAIKDWIKKQPHLHGNVCTGLDRLYKTFFQQKWYSIINSSDWNVIILFVILYFVYGIEKTKMKKKRPGMVIWIIFNLNFLFRRHSLVVLPSRLQVQPWENEDQVRPLLHDQGRLPGLVRKLGPGRSEGQGDDVVGVWAIRDQI